MALQNEDLFVIQREDTHLKVRAQDLVSYTNVGDYLPLSGGTVTGEIIFTAANPIAFSPGGHTIKVDAYDLGEGNVISNYSSLNFLLGPSEDSVFSIGDGDVNHFTVRGDGSVSLSEVDTPLTVPSLTSTGDIIVNNQVISATDAEMVVQGEGMGELGPIQTPNPEEDMPGDFIHDMVVEDNFGKNSKSFVLKINNDIYGIDSSSGKLLIKKYKNGLRNTNHNNPDEDLTDDPRFSIEYPSGWYIPSINIYYGAQGTERYIYIACQSVNKQELLIRYDSETVDIDGWEHQWLENPGATTAGGYDYGVNKFIYVGNDGERTYIKSLDPKTGLYENKVDVAASSASFGTYCNIYSYSGGKFYLNNGSKLYISEDGFDTYEIKTFSGIGRPYGHTIYQGKHYFITYEKKLIEIGDPDDTTTYKQIPLPSFWSSVSNRFMMYVVGDYIVFYQSSQTPTLFDGEKFYTSEGREQLLGYPQTPFSVDVYNESDEKVRTELLIPAGNKNVALLFDAPKGLIAKEPWTPVDYIGNAPDPEPAKLFFNDERIALASEIPDSSLLEHEVSNLDEKVEEIQEKLTDFVSEITTGIEDTLESANKYTDDEIIKANKHAEDYTDDKIISSVPSDYISDSGNNQVSDWTIDSGESRYISVRDNMLGLYHVRDPQDDKHAANKKYVDGKVGDTETFVTEELETRDETIGLLNLSVNSFEADLNTKLPLTGGTLEGDVRFQPADNGRLRIHVNNAEGQCGLDLRLGGNTYTNTFRILGGSGAETELFKVSADGNTVFLKDHVKTSDLEAHLDYSSENQLDVLKYSRFADGLVVKKTGQPIDGDNIFIAKPDRVRTSEAITSSSHEDTVVNKKYVDEKFSSVNVDTSSFATKTELSGYIPMSSDGTFSTSGKITSTTSGLSIKANIQYGGTTRIGIQSTGGYLGNGTSESSRALTWGSAGITQLMDSTGSNGSSGYYLKRTSSGVEWASVSAGSNYRGGGRRFKFGSDSNTGGFVVNDKWRFNQRDYDGLTFYHDTDEFYWSTPLKMTIWDSSGRLMAAAELGRQTDFTSSGSIRFRKSDGYIEHLYRGLSTNYIYTVCIEGYW